MKRTILVALGTATVISSAAALGIGAVVSSAPQAMTHSEYQAALRGIESARPHVSAKCEALGSSGRELCLAEASAYEMKRVADIEDGYRRTQQSARAAQRARIEARYQVERARCGALGGFKREQCLVAAHAAKGRAMMEAAAPYELRF